MNTAVPSTNTPELTAAENKMMAQAEPKALDQLDEHACLELERRLRRARDKHIAQDRREVRTEIAERGARAGARPADSRAREKSAMFSAALAVVNQRIAELERRPAAQAGPGQQRRVPAPRRTPELDNRRDRRQAAAALRSGPDKAKWGAIGAHGTRNQARGDSRGR